MWGQDPSLRGFMPTDRIIPMRVGTSHRFCDVLNKIKDHPHACGDKTWTANTIFGIVGSSPCVWGQVKYWCNKILPLGIIPMRVGTSSILATLKPFGEDHPHACGDKVFPPALRAVVLGSSPCVWGQD